MKTVQAFFEKDSSTLTYVVFDPETKDTIIIDPVLNYEPNGSTYWFEQIEQIKDFVHSQELHVHYCIDTHAHANHISATAGSKSIFHKCNRSLASP
ncbi:MAG: hypothetical protein R3A45_11085 [Bdellovibrionota bacterium]